MVKRLWRWSMVLLDLYFLIYCIVELFKMMGTGNSTSILWLAAFILFLRETGDDIDKLRGA